MTRVIFSRRHHPGSVLLRTAMWSPWSHCGVIVGDSVIEARADGGVVRTPLDEFKAHSSRWAIVQFPANENAVHAACAELGQPYDFLGVVGVGLHRRWGQKAKWFCSELVAHALEVGGARLFRQDARRITPQHLWMLNYPVVASK
jgi:uncharacterized protein YycO